ncbi:MAG: hypothetical protein L0Y71_10480 [Gemmataceae bacterium]|nr:hypothetical protein [Gemmataceae bacterium]
MRLWLLLAVPLVPGLALAQNGQQSPTERFDDLARRAAEHARQGDYARTIGLREEALKINPGHLDQLRFLIDDYLRLLKDTKVSKRKAKEQPLDNPDGFMTERLSMWQACYGHYKKLVLGGKIDLAEAVRRTHIMLAYPPRALMMAFPKDAEALRLDFVRNVFPLIGKIPSSSPHASTQQSEREGWRDLSMYAVRRFDMGYLTKTDLDLLADLIIKVIPDKTPLSSSMYFFFQQRPDELAQAKPRPGRFTEQDYLDFLERLKKSERRTAQMYGRYGWVYYHWLKPRSVGARPGPEVLNEAEALLKVFPRDNDYVYTGVRNLRFYLDKELNPDKYPERKVRPAPRVKKTERSTGALAFHPIDVKVKTLDGKIVPFKGRSWRNYHGWGSLVYMTPCEDGLDVFWNNGAVAFMKEKGVLEEIVVDAKPIFDDVKWDGLRVWIATRNDGLWVVDRSGTIVARIGAKEGLPPRERGVMLLPLAPGKVCAVGTSGDRGHAWCALATQPESGPATVHVFHRCTRVWASEDEGKENDFARDPAITFRPHWMHLYQRGKGKDPLILVGRYAATHAGRHIPLTINPKTLEVGVADFQTYFADHRVSDAYFSTNGRLFEAGSFSTHLLQPGPADPNRPKVFATTNNGMIRPHLLPYNGKLYLAGGLWFEIDPRTLTERQLTPQRLPGQYEGIRRHGVSTHYGLIGWDDWNREGIFYQITVAP